MPKKPSTKERTQVKALPTTGKKLSTGDMKEIKGGQGLNSDLYQSVVSLGKLGVKKTS